LRGRAAAGDRPDLPSDLITPAVLGPVRRFAELWLQGKTATPISEVAHILSDIAWRGLGGQPQHAATSYRVKPS
jgi:hypothetical protein